MSDNIERKGRSSSGEEVGQHVSNARLSRCIEQMKSKKNDGPPTTFTKVASNVLKCLQGKRASAGGKPNLWPSFGATDDSNGNKNEPSAGFKNLRVSRTVSTTSDSDRLINSLMKMDNVYSGMKPVPESTQGDDDKNGMFASTQGETLPLIGSHDGSDTIQEKRPGGAVARILSQGWGKKAYGSTSNTTSNPITRSTEGAHRGASKAKSIWSKGKSFCTRAGQSIACFLMMLLCSFTVSVGLPLFTLAVILFYVLESGLLEIDFFPGNATLCWWLIFAARQCVTLDVARIVQWILVDYIAFSSKIAVRVFGPFLTLVAIQSHGWPFLAIWWSLLDLIFLYGDNKFQRNWFHTYEEAIFAEDESGGNAILVSNVYLRLLLSALVAGLAATIKRTSLAMYFGQKTVVHYRSGLEKLLADISIVAEVAQLADEASKIEETDIGDTTIDAMEIRKGLYDTKWHTMTGFTASASSSQRNQEYVYDESEEVEGMSGVTVERQEDDDDQPPAGCATQSQSAVDAEQQNTTTGSSVGEAGGLQQSGLSSSALTGTKVVMPKVAVKDLLDSWDEPVNKLDKTDVSINDILQFQKALTYMDERFPFSAEFGPATTRDECVKSSQDVYLRLLKLSSRPGILSFDVLRLLSLDDNGVESYAKTDTLKRVFRPDKSDELPLLAFVQSCDAVYKRLRFFRASVRNSSVIDKVLQDIIDVFFYFAVALLVLSIMNFDPWPLLASVSTLLISFSFAFGNSTARIVDGILLIAAQRPFDLGDRIVINEAEDVVNYGVDYSWYVEDINLFTTTLRFAKTNEVATVSNGTIIQSRIVNCQRSPNALVTIDIEFRPDVSEDDVEKFVVALEAFVGDRPRIWDNLVYFQCESIDSGDGIIKYTLRVRHTKTWQDAPQILASKAELLKFCSEASKAMGINH